MCIFKFSPHISTMEGYAKISIMAIYIYITEKKIGEHIHSGHFTNITIRIKEKI